MASPTTAANVYAATQRLTNRLWTRVKTGQ